MNKRKIDYYILFAIIALLIIGLAFVYSASCFTALKTYNNSYYFFIKQLIGVLVGSVCMVCTIFIDLAKVKKFSLPLLIISVVLLGLVFIPNIGIENYGAKRWIGFGGVSFQPSELAKFAYVLFAAKYMSNNFEKMRTFKGMLPIVLVGMLLCALIILEPNMSITICIALTMLSLLFFGGVKLKHIGVLLVPIIMLIPILILIEPYRLKRILAFLDPWATPKSEGYQLIQSFYALGGGGLFGSGFLNGRQKFSFLPFAESDFIFSVIGEEVGFIGCLIVLSLFMIIIYRGVRLAILAQNRYQCYLSAGIVSIIAIQTLVNIAVVTGSIPPTGLPLPFISYGGSSIVMFMMGGGLLLNVSRNSHTKIEITPYIDKETL